MRIACFDIISGISGDMTLGAFVSAGVPLSFLRGELAKLPLGGYTLSERRLERSMISATKIDVEVAPAPGHGIGHDHRSYSTIVELIGNSGLDSRVKETAVKIFHAIAVAEARVHDTLIEEVHFHEVGAVDSIVDIVGIAICMEYLQVDKVFSTPVKTGRGGSIRTQHGVMPIPTPATMEILKGYPVEFTDLPFELTTPTGAGFIAALSEGLLDGARHLELEAIGYGAGSKEIPGIPNVLRLFLGKLEETLDRDEIVLLETNIDNMNPQAYPFIIEGAFAEGALDVFLTPILMKKGRPGHILSILCTEEQVNRLSRFLLRETTTSGIRLCRMERRKAARTEELVETSFGPVRVKIIERGDRREHVPEYEDCQRIAREKSLPLLAVYEILQKQMPA
jgi:pyridinium-3,5-bisthiocarboxylic acid mononucleotide nickel chelatase